MVDQIRLCGECEEWQPLPGPRINTHRYGTCSCGNITTKRVDFCRYVDRQKVNPNKRHQTALPQTMRLLRQQGMTNREIAEFLNLSPNYVKVALWKLDRKQKEEGNP